METKNFEIKITRAKLLREVNNDMVHNFYYLINARIESKEQELYTPIKLIYWCDIFDALEYYDQDRVTQQEISAMVKSIAYEIIDSRIFDFNDRQELIDYCNKTITDYNKTMRKATCLFAL